MYLDRASEMLAVSKHNLDEGFHTTAVNRAYYAVFYAANALLAFKQISRSKHSAVIAAFRQEFVRTEIFDAEFSRIYGRLMDDRNVADYVIVEEIEKDRATTNFADAVRFVERAKEYLQDQQS